MGLRIHHIALLLVLPGILTDEHINHNYDGANSWTKKMFYDNYKDNVKLEHTFRLLDYFNKENQKRKDYAEASVEDSDDFSNNLPESTTEEVIPQDNNVGLINSLELSRKTDLEERGLHLVERKHPPYLKYPNGKVEIHVFRGSSIKYTDVHGHSNYFAPWGYFITQPSNPEYKQEYYPPDILHEVY